MKKIMCGMLLLFVCQSSLLLPQEGVAVQPAKLEIVVQEPSSSWINVDKWLDEIWELIFEREVQLPVREDGVEHRINKEEFALLLQENLEAQQSFLKVMSGLAISLTAVSGVITLFITPALLRYFSSWRD